MFGRGPVCWCLRETETETQAPTSLTGYFRGVPTSVRTTHKYWPWQVPGRWHSVLGYRFTTQDAEQTLLITTVQLFYGGLSMWYPVLW